MTAKAIFGALGASLLIWAAIIPGACAETAEDKSEQIAEVADPVMFVTEHTGQFGGERVR